MTVDEIREQVLRDKERMIAEVDHYNEQPGMLNIDHMDAQGNLVRGDGIDCPLCLNKGHTYVVLIDDRGWARRFYKTCECAKRRLAVRRIRESGMERALEQWTFQSFQDTEPWQGRMRDTAMDYLREGVKAGAWMYVGGQSGCGKSHICTATAGVILRKKEVRYMAWPYEAQKAKAVANDAEAYEAQAKPLREAEALYIDDFLKPGVGRDGGEAQATAADLKLAFDILNYRYVNRLPTIISSEWFSSELANIDEAIAGRVIESAGAYRVDIGRDAKRNWRLKGEVI